MAELADVYSWKKNDVKHSLTLQNNQQSDNN